ncbi:MAG: NUDIX domain-containing protein [Pseudomonadota bacterium]
MTIGVRTLVIDEEQRVLLVRHGYTPGWHIPGGGVDRNETIEQAARRELEEETGFRPGEECELVGLYYNPRIWRGDHVAFYKFDAVEKVRDFVPNAEIREIGWFAVDALPQDATKSTAARLDEVLHGAPRPPRWSDR